MRNIILTFLLFLIISGLNAQSGEIRGKVIQGNSEAMVNNSNVYLENTPFGTIAKGDGKYHIKDVPAGNYTLVASNIGYLSDRKEITIKENEVLEIDLLLIETIATLNEVVVMTKGVAGLREIPGSVQYLPPKAIQKFSYSDINRILKTLPGINIQEEDGFGLRPNIGLRGTGVARSSKITIMEDGVLIAPAPYSAPAAYYFPTIGRMQAVEVMKGNSQIKYGPFTTGGAINLISTQIPEMLSGKLKMTTGSFGYRSLHAHVGDNYERVGYLVETFRYSSNGFKKLDGGGNTGFDKQDYIAKVRVNTSPDAKIYQSLTLKIGAAFEDGNETYLGLSDEDFKDTPFRRYAASQKDYITTSHDLMSLTHFLRLNKNISYTTTVYQTKFKRNWYKLDKIKDSTGKVTSISALLSEPSLSTEGYNIIKGASSTANDPLIVKANNRAYSSLGVQTAAEMNFQTGKIEHVFNMGLRIHKDEMDRFQWEDKYIMNNGVMQLTNSGIPGTESNRIESANAAAAYIQYDLKYSKIRFIPGIRYESIKMKRINYGKNDPERTGVDLHENANHVDVFIPGIGVHYMFDKQLNAFFGVHKGFSPPGTLEQTLPESSISYELGARYRKNALSLDAVLFYSDYSNLLGSDLAASGGDGSGDLFNAGEVSAGGLELQVEYDFLASRIYSRYSIPVVLAYTYTNATFENSFESSFSEWGTVLQGDQMPYMANNQLSILLSLEHPLFNLNLNGRYMDAMRTVPGRGKIPENEKTDSYFVIDISTTLHISKNVALFSSINNVTNDIYIVARQPAGIRPGMPRTMIVGLKAYL